MNLARAKRRWKAWDRYCDRCIKVCGGRDVATPAAWNAYNERVVWRNSGNEGPRRAWRWNRRTRKGPRR